MLIRRRAGIYRIYPADKMTTLSNVEQIFTKETDEQLNQLSTRLMNREQTLRERLSNLDRELLTTGRLMRSSVEGSTEEARYRELALMTLRRKKAAEKQLETTCTMAERVGNAITLREEAREAFEAQEALQQSLKLKSTDGEDIDDVMDAAGVYSVEEMLGERIWNSELLGIDDAELEAELEAEVYKDTPLAHHQANGVNDNLAEEGSEAEAQPAVEDKVEEELSQKDIDTSPADEEWLRQLATDNDEEVAYAAQMLRRHSLTDPGQ